MDTQRAIYVYRNGYASGIPRPAVENNFDARDAWRDEVSQFDEAGPGARLPPFARRPPMSDLPFCPSSEPGRMPRGREGFLRSCAWRDVFDIPLGCFALCFSLLVRLHTPSTSYCLLFDIHVFFTSFRRTRLCLCNFAGHRSRSAIPRLPLSPSDGKEKINQPQRVKRLT